jgi:protein tyrosine phosphatase (PTP) superfamily phosphohydrolase (DUF442 family)
MNENLDYLEQKARDEARESLRAVLAAQALHALVMCRSGARSTLRLSQIEIRELSKDAVEVANHMMREMYPD